jgi:uncharacterized membrane protein (UPF0127 family)
MKNTITKTNFQISKRFWLILFIGLASSLAVIFSLILFKTSDKSKLHDTENTQKCLASDKYLGLETIEIASTQEQQEKGLMERMEMCENQGMLFVYDEPQYLSFWMKNTYVSLDIIFINDQGVIDSIYANTTPQRLLPTYNSKSQCKYALEAKAGFSVRNNLKIGDKVQINKLMDVSVQYAQK